MGTECSYLEGRRLPRWNQAPKRSNYYLQTSLNSIQRIIAGFRWACNHLFTPKEKQYFLKGQNTAVLCC